MVYVVDRLEYIGYVDFVGDCILEDDAPGLLETHPVLEVVSFAFIEILEPELGSFSLVRVLEDNLHDILDHVVLLGGGVPVLGAGMLGMVLGEV